MKNLINRVKTLQTSSLEAIVSDATLQMDLFRIYSYLYLDGKQCRTCIRSQRKYLNEIKTNGLEMIEEKEAIKERTCQPKWKGVKMVFGNVHAHISAATITDKKAIEYLEKGLLKESDFIVLPKEFSKDVKSVGDNRYNPAYFTHEQQEIRCVKEFSELLKNGESKKSIKTKYKHLEKIGNKQASSRYIDKLLKLADEAIK